MGARAPVAFGRVRGDRVPPRRAGVGSIRLGVYDGGRLVDVGRTVAFTPAPVRRAAAAALARVSPGGAVFPVADADWIDVLPALVCEVRYERLRGSRFRHAVTFVRWLPDRDPAPARSTSSAGSRRGAHSDTIGPMSANVRGSGTPGDPWILQTPSLQGEFQMARDPDADPPALVVQVGKTELRYHLRASRTCTRC